MTYRAANAVPLETRTPIIAADIPSFSLTGATSSISVARGDPASSGIYLAALDDFPGRRLLADLSSVVYVPAAPGSRAHLLFLREATVMAQPFDEAALGLTGDPFVVAEQGSSTLNQGQVAASAAADGTLVYLAGRSRETRLTWFDRNGKELGLVGARGNQAGVALSPDGNLVAIGRPDPNSPSSGLWLHGLVRGSESRLTPAGVEVYVRPFPAGEGLWNVSVDEGREPRWSADGRELFFQRPAGADRIALFAVGVAPDGRGGPRLGTPQRLFEVAARTIVPQQNTFAYSPHPDGQRFLVNALADPGRQTVNVITNWQKAVAANLP